MTVLDDLQEDHSAAIVERLHAEVVQDDQIGAFNFVDLPAVGTIGLQHLQPGEQLLGVKIEGAVAQ